MSKRVQPGRSRGIAVALALVAVSVVFFADGVLPSGAAAEDSTFSVHVVRPGESLSEVALESGMTLDALIELNHIDDPDRVLEGTALVIRGPAVAERDEQRVEDNATQTYRVAPGDTLSAIEVLLDVDADTIRELNHLDDGDHIRSGTVLLIPVRSVPSPPSRVVTAVRSASKAYGLDPYVLLGLSYLESGWQMNAVSPVGAIGTMQLMPETAVWAINDLALSAMNWGSSLTDNTRVGAAYLDYLLGLSHGDLHAALAAYYQGWNSVRADGMLPETERYVDDVLALIERFRTQRPGIF